MSLVSYLRGLVSRFPTVSHGLFSLTDQGIVSATNFATMVIVGRATTPNHLGYFYLIGSIVFIAVGIQDQLVALPYSVRSKRHQGAELTSYSGSVWFHHLALTALGLVLLLTAIVALSLAGDGRSVGALWVLVAAGPFMLLREWIRRYAYAHLQIMPAIALDAIAAAVQLSGLLLLWHLQLMSVVAIFAVMGLACVVACIGWYVLDRPVLHYQRSRWVSDWTRNWSLGRWGLQSFLVGNTTGYIMSWILGLTIDTAAAGALAACVTLVNVCNVLLISLDRVLMPRAAHAYARGGCQDLRKTLRMACATVLPVLGAFCVFMFLLGSRLATLVYGHQYAGHAMTLSALSAAVFMNGVGIIATNGLWTIGRPRANFLADVAMLIATLTAAILLVVPLGVLGAALATLVGATTAATVRSLTLMRCLDRHVPEASVAIGSALST